jgi:hypothetical protein
MNLQTSNPRIPYIYLIPEVFGKQQSLFIEQHLDCLPFSDFYPRYFNERLKEIIELIISQLTLYFIRRAGWLQHKRIYRNH